MSTVGEQLHPVGKQQPSTPSIMVADGYGIRLHVERGHLVVNDGVGRRRRTRRLSRAERTVRRLVLLGHTGTLTLDAIRWCADVGVALVQIDTDGRVLMLGNAPSRADSRLLRAQAAAAGSDVGVAIAHRLLDAKLTGQAALTESLLGEPMIAETIRGHAGELAATTTLPACRDLEAAAANAYFAGWAGTIGCRFAARDSSRVPDHWTRFTARASPLHPRRPLPAQRRRPDQRAAQLRLRAGRSRSPAGRAGRRPRPRPGHSAH